MPIELTEAGNVPRSYAQVDMAEIEARIALVTGLPREIVQPDRVSYTVRGFDAFQVFRVDTRDLDYERWCAVLAASWRRPAAAPANRDVYPWEEV